MMTNTDNRLLGKAPPKGKRGLPKNPASPDSMFPVYERRDGGRNIDYTKPPAWAMKKSKFGFMKKTLKEKVKVAATKAVFIAGIVDLEDLALKEEARHLRVEREAAELGFFEQMFHEAEEHKMRVASEEERRMMVGPGSFAVDSVSNELGYEKDEVATKLLKTNTQKVRGAISSNKYTVCYNEGLRAMDGRLHSDRMTNTALKFACKLELKTQQHKEQDMNYAALYAERRAVKSGDRVAKQRQWVSKWAQQTHQPLLPGCPVALTDEHQPPWAPGCSPTKPKMGPLPLIQGQ
jgi:hypothetical protein